jgi:4-aminobutyrate aminotransferase/(S)-3-amino-2-methylpropionate transaminase
MMKHIRLLTEIPGPRSREILARRAAAVPAGFGRSTDVVVERAEGALVHDVDGNTLIDLAGGIGTLAVGHTPPSVVGAIREQAGRLVHVCALVATYEPFVRLAERLNEVTPGVFAKKTLLCSTGAEAVENAVYLARAFTGRPAVVCFERAFHGRSLLALSLTSKYGLFKKGFGPFAPEVYRFPAPYAYRRPAGTTEDEHEEAVVGQIEAAFVTHVDPSAVAALVVEPVQGEGGFIPLPGRFLARLRELCTQHGIVMIADEVQTGFGRTGRLFAIEHSGVVPDLVTMAKSLGAGMPIGAVTGRAEIMDAARPGGLGGTFAGNPLACAAALEAIEIVRGPGFLDHAERLGRVMREVLNGWRERWPLVGDVRGLGPMMLVELVKDPQSREPLAPEETLQVVRLAVSRGVLLIRAGIHSNCIRLMPPLIIDEGQLREGLGAVSEALAEALGSAQAVVAGT